MFLRDNGKDTLYQLGDLIEAKKVSSISAHAPFPPGLCPKTLTLKGEVGGKHVEHHLREFLLCLNSHFPLCLDEKVAEYFLLAGFLVIHTKSKESSENLALALQSPHLSVLWAVKLKEAELVPFGVIIVNRIQMNVAPGRTILTQNSA